MNSQNLKRTLTGKITSNKMEKTVTVLVERRIKHPLYEKFITRSKKYHAHNTSDTLSIGDVVLIEECRPLSKTKSWKVVKQVNKIS
jgi:small subunit ribosomal protein S17